VIGSGGALPRHASSSLGGHVTTDGLCPALT
jgi:hypothetical protein